jgi:transposase InsO family protein
MPWQPKDLMDTKLEFVELALKAGANRRELCRRFGISPKTGYELIKRYASEGSVGLEPRSRRPLNAPARSSAQVEQAVIELRREHPRWGGRKISAWLAVAGRLQPVPTHSTVTRILHRHGLILRASSDAATAWHRFEHDAPNALWQMDFKGHFETAHGRCNPFTVLDDHSRYSLAIAACSKADAATVKTRLERVFGHYGLPLRINADNGSPWGTPRQPENTLSELAIWLIRLGIRVTYSAPYHPQTNGKIERFHRSLKAEVLDGGGFADMVRAQRAFDTWRRLYNHERPHQALELQTPASRYSPSPRSYPSVLPSIAYADDDIVVNVGWNGWLKFKGKHVHLSNALHHLPVALRADPNDSDCFDVMFCHHLVTRIDLATLASCR